jgi:hypothetical protein
LLILHETHAARTLRETGVFPKVSIICLHSLVLFNKMQLQGRSKSFKIRPVSGRERTIYPYNVACENTQTHLVTQATMIELE